jgi:hypothetical protein
MGGREKKGEGGERERQTILILSYLISLWTLRLPVAKASGYI